MLKNLIKFSLNCNKSNQYRHYVRRIRNPVTDKTLEKFSEDDIPVDPESFDYADSNFFNVHKMHKQFQREEKEFKDKVASWMVGNKYFRHKQKNFLTWSEKEQIRYLHSNDPHEWTVAKLVESFPADSYAISKLIKSKWTPENSKRIVKHDESVKKNWKEFCSNSLEDEIDPDFAEHLRKFAKRDFDEVCKPKFERKRLYDVVPQPVNTEFADIITSCKGYQVEKIEDENRQIASGSAEMDISTATPPKDDMFLLGEIENKAPAIFKFPATEEKEEEENEESLETMPDEQVITLKQEDVTTPMKIKKYNDIVVKERPNNFNSTVPIREFIHIPKKLYKRGATYKIDDCFYDDDGEFLYRVPGLIDKK
uniref:Uncharacterized protein n=1 Tax=Corethrella appendiculata TaxID=1370023 RepID=U5ET21_9DIPT